MRIYDKEISAKDLADLLDENKPMHSLTGLASKMIREQADRIDFLTLMLKKEEEVNVSLFECMKTMTDFAKLRSEK